MEKGKKIIFITSQNVFNPSSGVESRLNNLIKMFSKENKLFIIAPYQKIKKQNYFGLTYSSKFKKLFDKRVYYISKNLNADIVIASTIWSGLNGLNVSKKLNKPFYFDDHNVEFLRFRRTGSWIWPLIYLMEEYICKRANKIICVSEKDKEYFIKYFKISPSKIEVIENPVDKSVFFPNCKNNKKIRKELGIEPNEKMILFFGQLDYKPNIEALEVIKEEILPKLKPNQKIVVCGKGDGKGLLSSFHHKNLIFWGFVDKIQDYINASDVVIAPLKSGSGTRIKILEALACKKRVISTSIGAEGIKKNKFLGVEDDWKRFVEEI